MSEIQNKRVFQEKQNIKYSKEIDLISEKNEVDDEDLLTIKDLCKIVKCDIKSLKNKNFLHDLICYSFSIVLRVKQYRDQIKEAKNSTKKIMDIIKQSNFRRELITVLSR